MRNVRLLSSARRMPLGRVNCSVSLESEEGCMVQIQAEVFWDFFSPRGRGKEGFGDSTAAEELIRSARRLCCSCKSSSTWREAGTDLSDAVFALSAEVSCKVRMTSHTAAIP